MDSPCSCNSISSSSSSSIQFIRTMTKIWFPVSLHIHQFTLVMLSRRTSCEISTVLPSLHWFRINLTENFSEETKKTFGHRATGSVYLISNWICLNQYRGLLNVSILDRKQLVYIYIFITNVQRVQRHDGAHSESNNESSINPAKMKGRVRERPIIFCV